MTESEPIIEDQSVIEDPRILFAGERTLLAWLRTAIALMGFGFVIARFGIFLQEFALLNPEAATSSKGGSVWFGLGLILLAALFCALAAREHAIFLKGVRNKQPYHLPKRSMGIMLAILLTLLAVGVAGYLLSYL